MHFFQLLKSLDELLYEIMSWLAFYPITLWRTIRHPMRMMAYADAQLGEDVDHRYNDALSPPIFLLLTVLFAHAVERALIGESRIVADTQGLAGLVSDDTSLIVMRLVTFAAFPVIMATYLVRRQHQVLNRRTLEEPFYSQCYATAPFALAFSLAATFSQMHREWAGLLAASLLLLSTAGWLAVQSRWFAARLAIGPIRGLGYAFLGYIECLAVLIVLAWLLGGIGI